MIVLSPGDRGPQQDSHPSPVIALFGVGLIGSAIRDHLLSIGYRCERIPLSWTDSNQQEADLAAILARLREVSGGHGSLNLSFVWSAGRAGFASNEQATDRELESFRRVLALARSASSGRGSERSRFQMVGSIGGLFEGQRHIGAMAEPRALRPYGRLKLDQECLLAAEDEALIGRVYRLTSVFGPSGEGRRKGLVSTLIENCYRHETTRIIGNSSTLRDYVWSQDIAKYICLDALSHSWEENDSIHHLGSGKPASIFEIVHDVQGATGLRALIRFEAEASNSSDITLAPSLLPRTWRPTDLGTAIRRTCLSMTAC